MIKINNFSYGIKKNKILKNINLEFDTSKIYGIIGPNGSGKSTLLKSIMKIYDIQKGSIFLDNKDINDYDIKSYSKKLSFVFQENDRGIEFTVEEMIMMGRYIHMENFEYEKQEDFDMMKKTLDYLGITNLRDKKISDISGGEAQKVFIARALVQDTKYILLDEPTSMLDIDNSIEIMNLVKSLSKDEKVVIVVLHDLNLALGYCDELILLQDGEVKVHGNIKNIVESKFIEAVYKHKVKIIKNIDGYYALPVRG